MTAATSTFRDRPPLRRRAVALVLALAIEALLILAFIGLNLHPRPPEFAGGKPIATFDIRSDAPNPAKARSAERTQQRQPDRTEPPKPRPTPVPPKIVLPTTQTAIIPMSRDELAAADISHLGSNSPNFGHEAGDSDRVGTAPNGEPLYAAEWYREPTNAELSAYMPRTLPEGGGAGLIACRTAARFHVEDCVELGNDPPGSHLAGAARQAAWQFLVRPPRVGGKVLVGTWVRIRIDYLPARPAR